MGLAVGGTEDHDLNFDEQPSSSVLGTSKRDLYHLESSFAKIKSRRYF